MSFQTSLVYSSSFFTVHSSNVQIFSTFCTTFLLSYVTCNFGAHKNSSVILSSDRLSSLSCPVLDIDNIFFTQPFLNISYMLLSFSNSTKPFTYQCFLHFPPFAPIYISDFHISLLFLVAQL